MTQRPRFLFSVLALYGVGQLMSVAVPVLGQRAGPDRSTTAQVEAIRKQYTRINSEAKHYAKKERDLSGFSTEGGTLIGFYSGKELRKMVATYYGESGRTIQEFYLADGTLFFVLSTELRYTRPLTFDGKDTGTVASSTRNRFYFNRGTLIRWIDPSGKSLKTNDAAAQRESREIRTSVADLRTRLSRPAAL